MFITYLQLTHHENEAHVKSKVKSNLKKTPSKRRPIYSSDSSSSSDLEEIDEEEVLDATQYITPKIINNPNCPESFNTFWNLSAIGYDKRRHFVAPHFGLSVIQAQIDLGMEDLVDKEFCAWALAFEELETRHSIGRAKTSKLKVGVRNTMEALQKNVL